MTSIGLLISGRGSNMDAILDRVESGDLKANVSFVASDRPGAPGLEKAAARGIKTELLPYENGKEAAEEHLHRLWRRHDLDWLVLAGFMRILSPGFVSSHAGRIVNIHPALLPSFPGAHGIEDAWNYGVKVTGVTVHLVDELVDHGTILSQMPVRVKPDDNMETLERRIHRAEHRQYWRTLEKLFSGIIHTGKDDSR
ncbi:phosphoribosylglycinamide formyltransferase [Dethiosulfovibrio sp. F2B]|uniref:phosphoribosylglycinamide formyltransferase n=1 Tax=Dethiosulfovibrio faecalis TaxID=2720018 RepID=UPI001F43D39A|nr:phosphoribosylglycinamide formyltransferase [Dethiosulfovibrio faecalis]MCF4150294.1 phosphoribosylglycinamide formyltransferase [Dethiosulfovibrio faecalis]